MIIQVMTNYNCFIGCVNLDSDAETDVDATEMITRSIEQTKQELRKVEEQFEQLRKKSVIKFMELFDVVDKKTELIRKLKRQKRQLILEQERQ